MGPAASPRSTLQCHALEHPTRVLFQMYSNARVIAGNSAKQIFPVLLLQIDSPTYRPSAFLCEWIPCRPRMRQINQTPKASFLPNLLPFQVIGIETEQIRHL